MAEFFHLGKKRGRDGGHVGRLRARNTRDEVHRHDEHVVQSSPDMAKQVGEKSDHPLGDPGNVDQHPEEDEGGNGEEEEVRHPRLDPRHEDGRRDVGAKFEIGEGGSNESVGDGHTGKHHHRHSDEEDNGKVALPECCEDRLTQSQEHGQHDGRRQRERCLPTRRMHQPLENLDQHQPDPHRHRGRPPRLRQFERRGNDSGLGGKVLHRRKQHEAEEHRDQRRAEVGDDGLGADAKADYEG